MACGWLAQKVDGNIACFDHMSRADLVESLPCCGEPRLGLAWMKVTWILDKPIDLRWFAVMRKWMMIGLLGLVVVSCAEHGIHVPSIFSRLKPQTYTWYPQRSTSGPVLVFVSIPRQEAVVYRNGIRIGRAAVSTGKAGHDTPTGVFQILQKDVDHHSKTYDNAPMPYMERLTWDGVALHAGYNPGRPDSHGCIRLPAGFAKQLYGVTRTGGTVVVSQSKKLPTMALTEGFGSGGSSAGGSMWSGKPGAGAVSMVISTTSRRVCVYQNGNKVGDSSIAVTGALGRFKGETVFMYTGSGQWQCVEGNVSLSRMKEDVRIPAAFLTKARSVMRPGTTMVVTSEPLSHLGGRSQGPVLSD